MSTAVATRRILKFRLPYVGEKRAFLAAGTRILAVGWQGRQLVMWVESPNTEALLGHVFTVAMTGDSVPEGEYIATAQLDDNGSPYVVHVYRRDDA